MGGLDIVINNAGIGMGTKEMIYEVNVVSKRNEYLSFYSVQQHVGKD